MTPAARLSAAIEVLDDIRQRRRPASDALKDWGLSHRFAGSGDRAAIASLVYDVLRRRSSAEWLMGSQDARATLLGALALQRGMDVDAIASLCSGARFAPSALTDEERGSLVAGRLADAPDNIRADVPDWLWAAFRDAFGDHAVAEGQALAARAPLDLRTNTLKVERERLLQELQPLGAATTPRSPLGLRIPLGPDGRGPSVQSEASFQKGWFEVQDEGSQIAALLAGAKPGEQVLDLCAGAGGKSLELAAAMGNKGQIYATDSDKRRLAPIYDRLSRAGVRNVQVRVPRRSGARDDLAGQMDLVLVDAPCSGSGTWRRNPDAKWRLRPNSLADRTRDQAEVLAQGAEAVRPGGRLAYITCSLLPEENDAAVEALIGRKGDFTPVAPERVAEEAGLADLAPYRSRRGTGLQLTPNRSRTDGFFIAILRRSVG
jgi:16S rRNA (cytosine967-C5)-methyltransferase